MGMGLGAGHQGWGYPKVLSPGKGKLRARASWVRVIK